MGYTTEFSGQFDCSPALDPQLVKDINDYAETRHFQRKCDEAKYGKDGEMFIDRDRLDILGYPDGSKNPSVVHAATKDGDGAGAAVLAMLEQQKAGLKAAGLAYCPELDATIVPGKMVQLPSDDLRIVRLTSDGFGENPGVKDYNEPAGGCPGLWCQWVATKDGKHIEWDGGEKFYEYVDWLKWIIEKFLKPNGIVLNGEVRWQGEYDDDKGVIRVHDNEVTADPTVNTGW